MTATPPPSVWAGIRAVLRLFLTAADDLLAAVAGADTYSMCVQVTR